MVEERVDSRLFSRGGAYPTEDISLWMDVEAQMLAGKSDQNFIVGCLSAVFTITALCASVYSNFYTIMDEIATISTMLLFIFTFYTIYSFYKSYIYFVHAEQHIKDSQMPRSFCPKVCMCLQQKSRIFTFPEDKVRETVAQSQETARFISSLLTSDINLPGRRNAQPVSRRNQNRIISPNLPGMSQSTSRFARSVQTESQNQPGSSNVQSTLISSTGVNVSSSRQSQSLHTVGYSGQRNPAVRERSISPITPEQGSAGAGGRTLQETQLENLSQSATSHIKPIISSRREHDSEESQSAFEHGQRSSRPVQRLQIENYTREFQRTTQFTGACPDQQRLGHLIPLATEHDRKQESDDSDEMTSSV